MRPRFYRFALLTLLLIALLLSDAIWPLTASAQTSDNPFADEVPILAPHDAFPASEPPSFLVTQTSPFDNAIEPNEPSPLVTTDEPQTFGSPLTSMLSPEELTPTLRTVLLVGILGLVPAVLVMTTCFARFAIVFGLLRQGLGAQQWLPNQIVLALSLFLTLLVMAPVWTQSYYDGLKPYADGHYESSAEQQAALESAFTRTVQPVRQFMQTQIAAAGNEAAVDMLLAYQQGDGEASMQPQYYEDVPLSVLLPAYLLSELKTAFVIGFQIVLPFLIIDLVVASVLTGMGLMLLPPVLVSLPFKLLLFVLIDGWTLTVEMLLSTLPSG